MNSNASLTPKDRVLSAVAAGYTTPRDIVRATKIKGGTVRSALLRLKAAGQVSTDSTGQYSITERYTFGPDKKPFAEGISTRRSRRTLSFGWIIAIVAVVVYGLLLWYL